MLLPFLLLQFAAAPEASLIPDEIPFEMGEEACSNPPDNDARPFMLCLAETRFEQAAAQMELQLKVTLAMLETARGAHAARRLSARQRDWVKRRDRVCEAKAAGTPTTQLARNTLSCQLQWTTQRTAHLKALAASQ